MVQGRFGVDLMKIGLKICSIEKTQEKTNLAQFGSNLENILLELIVVGHMEEKRTCGQLQSAENYLPSRPWSEKCMV